jgi:signal transduction histidine kinase/ActR/RegA family two-component response regulator
MTQPSEPPVTGSTVHASSPPAETEELLRMVVAHAPIVLFSIDRDGIFTLVEGSGRKEREPLVVGMAVGLSAFAFYGGVRVTESEARTTTGDSLLRRALAGESCGGLAEIGASRYDTKMVPLRGASGDLAGVIGVATDVSERVRAEAQLFQTDRLVALGTLAGGVAHEINNPLTYVMGNVDLVSRLLRARASDCRGAETVSGPATASALEELVVTLEVARDGAERVRRIVRDLTTFARSETDHRTLLDLRAVLEPVINLVSNEIRQRARLVRELRDVPLVDANEARLGQVFMNLLMNAVHAIPEGHADDHEIGITTSTDAAGRAVLEVRDTGMGIPEEVVARIFEPFFTTKPVGVGTGLGLSICHGTVTALGGEISVRSTPGAGSVFRVVIPPATRMRGSFTRTSGAARGPDARRAKVLLIDDEPLILESLRRALARYEVHAVTRAREALERIVAGERFDVIFCDLLMPGMSGMELNDELSRAAPEQAARIVFTTGGAFTARAREFLETASNPCIEKPFDLRRLHTLIQEITGEKVS